MKLSAVVTSVSVAVALTLAASQLASAARQPEKDVKKQAPAGQPDMEEMMKLGQPGEQHKMLAKWVGTWDCSASFTMPGPDGKVETMESTGVAKFTSELDGRWIRQDFKGQFGPEEFSGIGFNGYDNAKKKFVASWIDSSTTQMMTMTGDYDAATKTLTMRGTYSMPGMGELKARHTFEEKNPNTFIFTMYHTGADGKESKEGVITYKRRG